MDIHDAPDELYESVELCPVFMEEGESVTEQEGNTVTTTEPLVVSEKSPAWVTAAIPYVYVPADDHWCVALCCAPLPTYPDAGTRSSTTPLLSQSI